MTSNKQKFLSGFFGREILPPFTDVSVATLPFISLRGGKSDSVALELVTPVSKVLPWGRILGNQMEVGGDLICFLVNFKVFGQHPPPKKKARNQKIQHAFFWGGRERDCSNRFFFLTFVSFKNFLPQTTVAFWVFGMSRCRDEIHMDSRAVG